MTTTMKGFETSGRPSAELVEARWMVQRASVLGPLCGSEVLQPPGRGRAIREVIGLWKRFVDINEEILMHRILAKAPSLVRSRTAAERSAYARSHLQEARRCPQSYFWMPRTRRCGLRHLCPHCWSVHAGEFWDAVGNLLFALPEGGLQRTAAYDLIAVERIFDLGLDLKSFIDQRSDQAGDVPERRRIVLARRQELGNRDDVASFEALAVGRRGDRPRHTASIRQLYVVQRGERLERQRVGWEFSTSPPQRRVDLGIEEAARLVAWACEYPLGLLTPPPGVSDLTHRGMVTEYLEALGDRQLRVGYGALASTALSMRNRSPRPSSLPPARRDSLPQEPF